MSTGSKAKKATAALDLCIIVIYGKNALGCKGTHTPALKLPYSEQVLQSWITLQAPQCYGENGEYSVDGNGPRTVVTTLGDTA